MNEFYKELLLGILTLVISGIGTLIMKLISIKISSIRVQTSNQRKIAFLDWIEKDVIVKCINTTTQTYVQSLKDSNNFNKEAQKEALEKTVNAVKELLTKDNTEILSSYVGDITAWITTHIENYILESKK